jgi:hypothetical protein
MSKSASVIPIPLERAVLELVRKGGAKASWHWVGTRLPLYDVPSQPDALTTLKALRDQGWLEERDAGGGLDRWSLTARGLGRLEELERAGSPAAGPLGAAELEVLLTALRGGVASAITALMPFADDGPTMVAVLQQVLAADVALAERVAFGGAMLPHAERTAFARGLARDVRADVRRALFTAWAAARMDVPGQAARVLPDAEWDDLLRQGLLDADATVRAAAAALAFASDRGLTLRAELLANVDAAERPPRFWAILALGADRDAASLARLREIIDEQDPLFAAAAVRALAARPDGHERWLAALTDERPDVQGAAVFALAEVAVAVLPARLAVVAMTGRPSVQAALGAYRARNGG